MRESKAKDFALRCHSGHMYGNKAYSFHLQSVVDVAKEFDLPEEVVTSCWLHDVIEDCGVTYQQIKKRFGEDIAENVYSVTDELGRNRKERKSKTYPKIRSNEMALCVRLCDRISNVRQAQADSNVNFLKMYKKEHEDFRSHLYWSGANEKTMALWEALDSLINEVKY